ncbi:MAG: hypothetical protein B6U89_05610 [Desulfurococcales archaeon ex4484_58]|nr:MAG: hypothetical protein B6U89_05610 [Desulfurococcales archaeon ex4484_58]
MRKTRLRYIIYAILWFLIVISLIYVSGFYVFEYQNSTCDYSLAYKYRPIIVDYNGDYKIINVYYTCNTTTITYYIVWEDEDVDIPGYRLFRALYYGSTKDIEPLVIKLNEDFPSKIILRDHMHRNIIVTVVNDTYAIYDNVYLKLENYRIRTYIVSENHGFGIKPNPKFNYSIEVSNYSIEKLDLSTYLHEKIGRRFSSNLYIVLKDLICYMLYSVYLVFIIVNRKVIF